MTTLRTVEEAVPEMTKHTMWRDNEQRMLEDRLTELLTQDRADIAHTLCTALEGMMYKEFRKDSPAKHQNDAFIKAITLIKTTLSTTKTEV